MRNLHLLGLILLSIVFTNCRQNQDPPVEFVENKQMLPPNERWGDLFEAVQLAGVFPDGKTFVDCIPKYPTDQILASYSTVKDEPEFHLRAFVLENFELPPDYASDFETDPNRSISEHIKALWPVLTRQPDAETNGSLVGLKESYVVPGGRFREVYYWDSFFTMLGLQVDGETDLIYNMTRNFAHLIDTVGFIPNGNRTYYLTRSQPPFFAAMVALLAEARTDSAIYTEFLPALEGEYDFWMNGSTELSAENRTVQHVVRLKDGQLLNRYFDRGDYPRAESFREDIETAKETDRPTADVYRHLRSGAESGWDYSTRWFADVQNLSTIHTTDIIPVDLNALLYNLEKTLATAYRLSDDEENATIFDQRASQRAEAIQSYCWDAASGFFRDYDFVADELTPVPSLAATYPLYFGIATQEQAEAVAASLEQDFLEAGGLLSTLNHSGQQWDAPNGWAPLQWMAYQGLKNYGLDELANTIRDRWIEVNIRVYENTGKMVEKYNVVDMSLEAGGGEYPVQDGFGWSNGVLQRFLQDQQND